MQLINKFQILEEAKEALRQSEADDLFFGLDYRGNAYMLHIKVGYYDNLYVLDAGQYVHIGCSELGAPSQHRAAQRQLSKIVKDYWRD